MEFEQLKPIVEAMIFVAEEPVTDEAMAEALADEGVTRAQIRDCVGLIESECQASEARGLALQRVAGGYQFRTKPQMAPWLKKLHVPKPMRLTGPSLETLAIVAYRQPIVRSDIERIRGVDTGGVLKSLLERRLIRIVGRRDEPGQPLLYGTSREFLEIFNLNALSELPALKDIEDLLREHRMSTDAPGKGVVQAPDDDRVDEQSDPAMGMNDLVRRDLDEEVVEADRCDMAALDDLDQSLKDLRKLERVMFPKPLSELDEAASQENTEGAAVTVADGAPEAATSQPDPADGSDNA